MIKKLILTASLAAAFSLQAQVVSLFAGSQYEGEGAYSGATSAIPKFSDSFSKPWGIAADTSNRFWITEQHNLMLIWGSNSIVKGGNTGNPNVPGGAGYDDKTGTQSLFANPAGCAVNPKTNRVFICDVDNNVIRYQNSSVVNTGDNVGWGTFAGASSFMGGYTDGAVSSAEFAAPQDLAISSTGVVYVADRDNHCIRKISGGQVSTIAGLGETSGDANGTGSTARFYAPCGLFLIDDNTLLVADRNNGKIKQIDLTNNSVTTVVTGLNMPTDVVKINGTYYIADALCIRSWNGTTMKEFAGKVNVGGYVNASDVSARFRELTTLIYHDKTKSMYVADMGNNVFRQITVIQPPVANFSADKTNVTVGQVVTLTSSSTNATNLLWNISPGTYTLQNGTKLTDQVVMVSFDQTGSYTVELTATNPAASNKMTKASYINVSVIGANKPSPDFYADKLTPAVGETVSFIDQTGDNPQSFSWSFTPNTVTYQGGTTSNSRFPKVSFNAAGKYTVQLDATNTNGTNSKTKVDYITVSTAAVTGIRADVLNVYPNPASDQIFVSDRFASVTITDLAGKQVQQPVVNGYVRVSELGDGVYVVLGIGADGTVFRGRFVKNAN